MAEEVYYALGEGEAEKLRGLLGGSDPQASGPTKASEPASVLIAVTTSTITARAGTTLGTGTAQAKWINSSNVLQNNMTLDVLNPGSAIASGAYVLLFRTGGKWLAVEVC